MDLALAHAVAQRLAASGKKLDGWQFRALVHACRAAKEALLGAERARSRCRSSILGRGSQARSAARCETELTRERRRGAAARRLLPRVGRRRRAPQAPRALGLSELGLPYASDAGDHAPPGRASSARARPRSPTAVLFNGGVMKGELLRARVAEVVGELAAAAARCRCSTGTDLDLAVARGAAYYGLVRRGRGIRIRGGTARAYYVGVESAMPAVPGFAPPVKALCVAPFGMEEGTERRAARRASSAWWSASRPTFRFFASSQPQGRPAGAVVDPGRRPSSTSWRRSRPPAGRAAPTRPASWCRCRSTAHVTEVGTLELWCVGARAASGAGSSSTRVREGDERGLT